MNTDQGSQYTGAGWITTLTKADIKISMDGRGRYLDNTFIERLWRSLKQEAVYLHEIIDGFQAKRIIDSWIEFYNSERPHNALDKRMPVTAYFYPSGDKKNVHVHKPDISWQSRKPILKSRTTSVKKLIKDRDVLLTFYDFPAE